MAITSGFHNSINGDRKYGADFFALFFGTLIANGVFPNPSTGLQVTANSNMTTSVKAGKGWINGYFIVNDGDYVLKHDNADGLLKRIDRVVMKLNHIKREIEVLIKKGTFASTPVAPTLQRDADAYELALADVLINNGVTQITQANITDQRLNSALCGIVHGTVNQVDTTTIFNQYQAWFTQTTNSVATDLDIWKQHTKDDFNIWFDSIKDILNGDVAGNLAARIAQLEVDFGNHNKDAIRHNNYGRATGTNALIITSAGNSKPITAYTEGMSYKFKNTTTNTSGTMTVNIDGLGVKNLRRNGNLPLPVGGIKASGIYNISYDGSVFTLTDEGGEYGDVTTNDVRKGKIFGTVDGLKTGTLDLSNLKPENLRRGVTIDGVAGGIDKAHGVLVKPEDITKAGKVRENFQQCYFTIDDNEYYEAKSTGTTHVVNKYNAAGALVKTVPIAGYTGEAYYVEIPRYGEVQFMRQYHMIGAFDWDTGVLKDIVYTSNFGEPKAAIQYNPKNSYDRLIIGNVGTHTYTGVYNRSNVLLDGLSWLEVIDGYGMTRQMSDTAWIVTGRGAGGLLTVLSPDSQGIDMNYFNTTENASSTLQRVCGCLLTYGRKI